MEDESKSGLSICSISIKRSRRGLKAYITYPHPKHATNPARGLTIL